MKAAKLALVAAAAAFALPCAAFVQHAKDMEARLLAQSAGTVDDGGDGLISDGMLVPPQHPVGFEPDAVRKSDLLKILTRHFHPVLAQRENRRLVHKWSHYFALYEQDFSYLRNSQGAHFVEVGGFAGGSAQMWAEWFGPGVTIHLVELNNMSAQFMPPNVRIWRGDQSNVSFWRDEFFPQVPIVDGLLDDGGHTWLQQVVTVREALPHIRRGAVLMIEDTHTSFLQPGWGGTFHEHELVGRTLRLAELQRTCDAANEQAASLPPTGVTAETLRTGFGAWADVESPHWKPDMSTAAFRAMERDVRKTVSTSGEGITSLGGTSLLPTWSFVDEAKSLSHDLALARALESTTDPVAKAELVEAKEELDSARRLRASVLDTTWRNWFGSAVESVKIAESIVSFRVAP